MTPQEAWEKYAHLDHLLSDRDWLSDVFWMAILYDLWSAVKTAARQEGD